MVFEVSCFISLELMERTRIMKHLKCPYCNGHLSVVTEMDPNPYNREYFTSGFECDDCEATWDKDGAPSSAPKE